MDVGGDPKRTVFYTSFTVIMDDLPAQAVVNGRADEIVS